MKDLAAQTDFHRLIKGIAFERARESVYSVSYNYFSLGGESRCKTFSFCFHYTSHYV